MVLPEEVGPPLEEQAVIPAVPFTIQEIAPVGATALVAPVTVAVIVSDPPRRVVVGLATRLTVGVALATTVVVEEVVAATGL